VLFYYLAPLADQFSPMNLFRYITFRAGGAFMTALLLSFLIGGRLIAWLRSRQGKGQPIREDGPEGHLLTKKGTPTMGGFLILIALTVATLLWADLGNRYIWVVLLVTLGFGAIGFLDDFLKVTKRNTKGLPGWLKLLASVAIAVVAVAVVAQVSPAPLRYQLALPFLKNVLIPLSLVGFFVFAVLVIVGASNAVNLTDGLDGLAVSTFAVAAAAFTALAYVTGHRVFAEYLLLVRFEPAAELTIFCSALVGASLGFLWYNAHPAEIFMGDVGSLALGGAIATVAMLIKQELLLVIVGGIFVIEAASVVIQVVSFKTRGKRVFKMAPLHHHFEQLGWEEPKVITRFLIVAILFALFSLTTLKLR
jgi:phospho-N-acetylmuramoyl-pentapeptide-transferase